MDFSQLRCNQLKHESLKGVLKAAPVTEWSLLDARDKFERGMKRIFPSIQTIARLIMICIEKKWCGQVSVRTGELWGYVICGQCRAVGEDEIWEDAVRSEDQFVGIFNGGGVCKRDL